MKTSEHGVPIIHEVASLPQPVKEEEDRQGFFAWLFGQSKNDSEASSRVEALLQHAYPSGHWASCPNKVEYNFEELQVVGMLGYGAFGSVNLVRQPSTGQTFAL